MPEMRVMSSGHRKDLEDTFKRMGVEKMTPGDTKVNWDKDNPDEVQQAKRTFTELLEKGFKAFKIDPNGKQGSQLDKFDINAEKLVLIPPMAGG